MLFRVLLPAACGDATGQEHRLLFPEPESRLPAADMAGIFADFSGGLTVSADGSGLEDPYCGNLDVETTRVDTVCTNNDPAQQGRGGGESIAVN